MGRGSWPSAVTPELEGGVMGEVSAAHKAPGPYFMSSTLVFRVLLLKEMEIWFLLFVTDTLGSKRG